MLVNIKNKSPIPHLERFSKRQLGNRLSGFAWSVLRLLLLIGLSYVILYPIIFCISLCIRQPGDMVDPTVIWLPKNFTVDNVLFVLKKTGFISAFWKSAAISLSCSVLQMLSCSVVGYGFARFRFKGRNILFLLALMTFIVPPQILSMPLYIQYAGITAATAKWFGGEGLQIINTVIPVALPALFAQGMKSALFIYLFRQTYKSMPLELENAAYLDGCGPIKAFIKIMFPNSSAILLVTFVLSFSWYWNDYVSISLFFNKSKPLAVMLKGLMDTLTGMVGATGGFTDMEKIAYQTTFCLLFIAVPIVLYGILQKKFTESLMSTSIVG